MKKYLTKRLISVILCFVIMIGTCWLGAISGAAQQINAVELLSEKYGTVNTDNTITWQKNNVAVGSAVSFSWDADGTSTMNNKVEPNQVITNLFDSNTSTRSQLYIDNKIKKKPDTFYITVTLPSNALAEALILLAKNQYIPYIDGYIGLKSFEIYASANRGVLYSSQPVATIDRDRTDSDSWFEIELNNQKIRYIGIKVLELNSIPDGTDHSGTFWAEEVAVLGEATSNNLDSQAQLPAEYGTVDADNTITWQKDNIAAGSSLAFSWDADGNSAMNNKVDSNKTTYESLFDNNTSTRMQYYINNKIKQKPTTFYMTITLPADAKAETMLIMAKNQYIAYVDGYIGLKNFEVYASFDRNTLYSSQPIATVNRDKTDTGEWYEIDLQNSMVRYIGIKVLELNSVPDGTEHSGTLWAEELAVLGTALADNIESNIQLPSKYGKVRANNTIAWEKDNVASGSAVSFSWDAKGTEMMLNMADSSKTTEISLFDNNTTTRMQYYINNQIKKTPDTFYMTVTLPGYCNVDSILLMASHKYIEYIKGYISLKNFEIYASEDREGLYSTEPIATVNRDENNDGSWFITDTDTLLAGKEIRYIGIKVLELNFVPNGTEHSGTLWIEELAVLGKNNSKNPPVYKKDNEVTEGLLASLGENLLANAKMQGLKANGDSFSQASWNDGQGYSNRDKLTDSLLALAGTELVRFVGDDKSMPITIVFDMRRSYSINALSIAGISGNNNQLSAYSVYVSSDRVNLVSKENLVLFYNNYPNYYNDSTAGHAQVFNLTETVEGRFVAFVLERNKSTDSYSYTRQFLRELGVYGTVDYGYETNLLKNTVLDVDIDSSPYEISAEDINTITDNVTTAEPNISVPASGKKATFVYDIGGNKNFTGFRVAGGSEQKEKLLRQVNIYASLNRAGLFDSENLVYSYTRADTDTNRIIEYMLSEEKVYQYVAFEIVGGSDGSMLISEIAALGLSWQLNARENQVFLIGNSSVKPYIQDIASGLFYATNSFADRDSKSQPDITSYAFDGNIGGKNLSIYGSQKGTQVANLVIDLGNSAFIDAVGFYGIQHKSLYNAKKIEIYIAGEEEDLWNDATPVVTIEDAERLGKMEAEFMGTSGRYVRFCILEGADESVCYGSEVTVISEVTVYGSSFSSQGNSFTPSFTDEKTGVSLAVNPLNYRDYYDRITSMTVKQLDASFVQTNSQYLSNLILKDGKYYQISLFDKDGNLVTDLGGRTVTITVPVDEALREELLYLSLVNDDGYEMLELELLEEGFVYEVQYSEKLAFGLAVSYFYTDEEISEIESVLYPPEQDDDDNANEGEKEETNTETPSDDTSAPQEETNNEISADNDTDKEDEKVLKRGVRKKKRAAESNDYTLIIVIIAIAAVIVLGGGVFLLIFLKKRKKRSN